MILIRSQVNLSASSVLIYEKQLHHKPPYRTRLLSIINKRNKKRRSSLASRQPEKLIVDGLEWFSIAVAIFLAAIVFVFLPRGLELTDTGFYYNSISNLNEIDMQTTQFAVILHPLSFIESIYLHRVIAFLLLFAAAFYLLMNTARFLHADFKLSPLNTARFLALSGLCLLPFYELWLPDPSYNSVCFTLLLTLFGLAFKIAANWPSSFQSCRTAFFAAGLIIIPLFLTRPFAPIVAAPFILFLIIVFARPNLSELLKACVLVVAGMATYLILQGILVEPIWTTIERMQGGFDRRALLARESIFQMGFEIAVEQNASVLYDYFSIYLLLTMLLALSFSRDLFKKWASAKLYIIARNTLLALLILFIIMNVVLPIFAPRLTQEPIETISLGMILFSTIATATIISSLFLGNKHRSIMQWKRLFVLFCGLVIAWAAFFGTANGWAASLNRYSGAFLMMALIIFLPVKNSQSNLGFAGLIITASVVSSVFLINMVMHPYRLVGPLTNQVTKVDMDKLGSIRVDPESAFLIKGLLTANDHPAFSDNKPMIIDISGRHPMIAYILGASTPRSPWILSGYNGSQALFDFTYENLPQRQLSQALILEAPDLAFAFDTSALSSKGLNFPKNYDLIFEGWSPYYGSSLKLWAPKHEDDKGFAHEID